MNAPLEAKGRRLFVWLRVALSAVAILLAVLAAVVGWIYFDQRAFIYHPRAYAGEPPAHLLPDEVVLHFRTTDAQVAFYFPQGRGANLPDKLWLAFCGNGSLALDWIALVRQTPTRAGAFLVIEYPGYGGSTGLATIASTEAAADGALKALALSLGQPESELEPRLNVLGHSLGAAAALEFCAHHPVQRVLLLAPFTTLREEAARVVGRPLSHLLVENYDNRARLRELSQRRPPPRVAIFHGVDDGMIPFTMGQSLAQEFPGMIQFFPVAHADHTTVLVIGLPAIAEWISR